ncbi:MAG: SPOR domain-containing protein, partial [Spirochaetales bacterium]|nr:SPOR domain-containing protein [Spirochaetales bacterium]
AASSASAAVVPPVQASAAPIAAAIAPAPAPAAISGLPFISSFAKGSYYVQIASCAETLNAKKIVDEWGASYPVVVERSSGAKGELLKVYVGPVQKDEYGAVLERFRQLGFKDAFVKKAN